MEGINRKLGFLNWGLGIFVMEFKLGIVKVCI